MIGRKAPKVGFLGADPTWKASWRMIRSWVCHNHKIYYTVSIFWAFALYNIMWNGMVGYYRQRNHHRSLEWAINKEREWDLIKPKEEEYDDEEDEDEASGDEAAAAGGEEEEE